MPFEFFSNKFLFFAFIVLMCWRAVNEVNEGNVSVVEVSSLLRMRTATCVCVCVCVSVLVHSSFACCSVVDDIESWVV